jgi:hypothetical protein
MGLFGIFKKKQKSEEIALTKLDEWLSLHTRDRLEILNASIKEIFEQIEETIQNLEQGITLLQNAEIADADKIQPKVKSIVLGHRQNYIRRLTQLISAIRQPAEISHTAALEFYETTQQELDKFSQETTKSYYAVQHLFHKEIDEIAKLIKLLDKHTDKIKKLIEKSSAVEIDHAKQQISHLQGQIEKKALLEKELEILKSRLEKAENSTRQSEQELNKLLESREYLELQELNQKLANTKEDMLAMETQITHLFSPIERPLRKFSKITLEDEKLVQSYSEKPSQALLEDRDLKIVPLLQKMKNSILSNAVELKDKKKEKTLETIKKLAPEYLRLIIANFRELEEKQGLLEKQIRNSRQEQIKKELEYKLEHTSWIVTKLHQSIEETEKNHQKINIEKLKAALEQQLEKLTKTEAKIVI